jgi:hypothetical protein
LLGHVLLWAYQATTPSTPAPLRLTLPGAALLVSLVYSGALGKLFAARRYYLHKPYIYCIFAHASSSDTGPSCLVQELGARQKMLILLIPRQLVVCFLFFAGIGYLLIERAWR